MAKDTEVKESKETASFYLDTELIVALEDEASMQRRSVSQQLNTVLSERYDTKGKKK